ncbi:hypothetical protein N9478_00760 [Gammaproteobacteria bacterium]|nr:hypothetical protein [Gammaproteobacteria bacterium]
MKSYLMTYFLKIYWLIFLLPAIAAEAGDDTVLTVKGNLINRVALASKEQSPDFIIATYYDLLADVVKDEIVARRLMLENLLPNYEVAYLAADSAEMAEVRDKIDLRWARIQSIHIQFFNAEVVNVLNTAYIAKFKGLLPEHSE